MNVGDVARTYRLHSRFRRQDFDFGVFREFHLS